jgi:hypothetical protein
MTRTRLDVFERATQKSEQRLNPEKYRLADVFLRRAWDKFSV